MIYSRLTTLNLATVRSGEIKMVTLTIEQLTYIINCVMDEAAQGAPRYQLVDVENWMKMIQQETQNATSNIQRQS